VKKDCNLGVRRSFADIGATVYEYLTGEKWNVGESFLDEIYEV
jgi:phosphopentomutase